MSDAGQILVERDGPVATLTVDRPPHNHVTVDLIRNLADRFDELDADPSIRASVLQTTGKVFCAGAELADGASDAGVGTYFTEALYAQALRLFSGSKPIVAAIQGPAIGAGLGLALVADFRVVAPQARFAGNFVKLGFHPGFGITYTLPRLIGEQRAALMLLTGRRIDGQTALEWGLADELASAAELGTVARALAGELAENAPLAVQSTRQTLRAGLVDGVRAATALEARRQAVLRRTDDFREGVRAVAQRRPGRFAGR
jgi:enoyl-CoA hydratase/carnithine racemase